MFRTAGKPRERHRQSHCYRLARIVKNILYSGTFGFSYGAKQDAALHLRPRPHQICLKLYRHYGNRRHSPTKVYEVVSNRLLLTNVIAGIITFRNPLLDCYGRSVFHQGAAPFALAQVDNRSSGSDSLLGYHSTVSEGSCYDLNVLTLLLYLHL